MARPIKNGMDYFPLDVDFPTNEKVEAIMGEFGSEGVVAFLYLLSAIYRNGYFLKWDRLSQMQLVNRIDGMTIEKMDQLINRLISYDTFSEEAFEEYQILTSKRVQATFLEATKRRKEQPKLRYLVNDDNNLVSSVVNVDNNPSSSGVNVDISTQSKVKERKEKKSKQKQSKEIGPPAVAFQKTLTVYQQNIGVLNPLVQQNIEYRINDFVNQGTNEIEANEIVQLAIEKAALSNKLSWNYADGILKNWLDHSLFTLSNVKAEQKPKTKNEPYSVDESDKLPY
ncbi:Lin1244/Lin1753 domain-containing protein [Companilactobacillus ginsenosidimutans]|uniref:Lin1244/Lin1753 domain-containing protein n=1 Tax=Companilactobacillus ginsenosidimutans TaxID=1007676 RepID=UPI00069EA0A4|nr:Lin1244/Lin1753 domain-containing protein [Companilactobacillus ginsenosidimutans]